MMEVGGFFVDFEAIRTVSSEYDASRLDRGELVGHRSERGPRVGARHDDVGRPGAIFLLRRRHLGGVEREVGERGGQVGNRAAEAWCFAKLCFFVVPA